MPVSIVPVMAALAGLGFAPSEPPAPSSLLITGVVLVDTEEGTVSTPRDILIEDGRIVEIEAAGRLSRDRAVTIVDGTGKYALPGLIDVHAHLGDGGARAQTDDDREQALRQFLRYGVTTIFVPGGGGGNDDQLARWRVRCAAGEIACPGLYGSGAIITAAGSHPISTIFGLPVDADPAVAYERGASALRATEDPEELVATRIAKGADAIKIVIEDGPPPWYPKPRLSDEQVGALASAAHRRNVPIYAHVSRAAHVASALDGGVDGIMHAPLEPMPAPLLRRMTEARMFLVATLSLYDGIDDWTARRPEDDAYALAGVSKQALESLAHLGFLAAAPESTADARAYVKAAGDNLVRAAAMGVPLALGTDTSNPFVYPGYAAHEELALMVASGLTPGQALRAATSGGAAFLGKKDRLGRIAPGYEADMLILRANPLADIAGTRAIDTVVSDGRIIIDPVSTAPTG